MTEVRNPDDQMPRMTEAERIKLTAGLDFGANQYEKSRGGGSMRMIMFGVCVLVAVMVVFVVISPGG